MTPTMDESPDLVRYILISILSPETEGSRSAHLHAPPPVVAGIGWILHLHHRRQDVLTATTTRLHPVTLAQHVQPRDPRAWASCGGADGRDARPTVRRQSHRAIPAGVSVGVRPAQNQRVT